MKMATHSKMVYEREPTLWRRIQEKRLQGSRQAKPLIVKLIIIATLFFASLFSGWFLKKGILDAGADKPIESPDESATVELTP